jgi:hypothetical protein
MNENNDLYALARPYPPASPVWSLVDAFDAVTNGMDNPESFASMEKAAEPQFRPWKYLIYGIRALYSGDTPGCEAALEAIEDGSAPGALKPLFRAWVARQGTGRRKTIFDELSGTCNAVITLYRRLIVEPHPLSLLAEQAEEALNHGLTEQFALLAGKIMKSLEDQKHVDGPLLALRYVRYCLDRLDKAGWEESDFFSVTVKTLGEADGFCVLGFALIGRDDEAAAAALEKALASGSGRFLDAAMASLVREFLPALKEGSVNRIPEGRPYAGSYETNGPACIQLELFGGTYG